MGDVSAPLAFISYSTKDLSAAREVARALRDRGIEVWIDEEQIRFGESIPRRISDGLDAADVLLVLVSKHFVSSSWCRAEYEPLLVREIDTGVTAVIPVRLDDAEVPALLAAKRYVDLRDGSIQRHIDELQQAINAGRSYTRVNRLRPETSTYEASALSMIISSTLDEFPVSSLSDEQLVAGHRLVDLYSAVERLVEQYQAVFDELFEVLRESRIEEEFYGSGYALSYGRLTSANRKLQGIAAEMREIAGHLDTILRQDSRLRSRMEGVLELCVQISIVEDFLVIGIGAPAELSSLTAELPLALMWSLGAPVPDNLKAPLYLGELGAQMLREISRVRSHLDAYRRELRSAVARATAA